eukprot:3295845-Rhodomonas_salina.1
MQVGCFDIDLVGMPASLSCQHHDCSHMHRMAHSTEALEEINAQLLLEPLCNDPRLVVHRYPILVSFELVH